MSTDIKIDAKVCELSECDIALTGRMTRYCSVLHLNRASHRSWMVKHREQDAANSRQWRSDNPDKLRTMNTRYYQTDAGYAKFRASGSRTGAKTRGAVMDPDFTTQALEAIFRDTTECEHCEMPLPDMHDRKIDHIIAIVNGGEHMRSNIQILCDDCHKIKSHIDSLERWAERGGMVLTKMPPKLLAFNRAGLHSGIGTS